ncbi:MAG: hypothetical protein CVT70_01860 [Alphaproteobacteria bacterium HGW-Alphaproteobacteria-1]|jgi:hypothetical protein|nr:MAG: hypothetical protein CVT70_01860 [Alphaproteobacteria bacterium HGW-Alphaproteobacteria-1]
MLADLKSELFIKRAAIVGSKSMSDAATITEELRRTEALYPIPAWDEERRKKRLWVLRPIKPGGVGLEAGVFRGCFSQYICEIAQPRKLYLFDTWRLSGETFGWGREYTCFGKLETAVARRETELRVSLFPDVDSVIIEGFSPACADQIEEALDWAYLDTTHQYRETLLELEHLEQMIAPGGLILGDDWAPDPNSPHHIAYRAVHDFVGRGHWETIKAGPGHQWALRRSA